MFLGLSSPGKAAFVWVYLALHISNCGSSWCFAAGKGSHSLPAQWEGSSCMPMLGRPMDLSEAKLHPGHLILEVLNTLLFNWVSLGAVVLRISEDQNGNIELWGERACQACVQGLDPAVGYSPFAFPPGSGNTSASSVLMSQHPAVSASPRSLIGLSSLRCHPSTSGYCIEGRRGETNAWPCATDWFLLFIFWQRNDLVWWKNVFLQTQI